MSQHSHLAHAFRGRATLFLVRVAVLFPFDLEVIVSYRLSVYLLPLLNGFVTHTLLSHVGDYEFLRT